MAKRECVSKKIRFEVFKRDLFTCQYCGKKAPAVILEIDHIKPVSKDGTNDIENLVSACFDCNRGKGARKLSDLSEVEKSRRQLEELQEKKNMVDMILEWKKSLRNTNMYACDGVEDLFTADTGYTFTKDFRKRVVKAIKDFGFDIVIDSMYTALDSYYVDGDEKSADIALKKLCGIAFNKHAEENNPKRHSLTKIKNMVKKRYGISDVCFYSRFPHKEYSEVDEAYFVSSILENDRANYYFEAIGDYYG